MCRLKLILATFFGELPEWIDKWHESISRLEKYGYHYRLITDLDDFNRRAEKCVGYKTPIVPGTGKAWDWRPALGLMYQKELKEGGYDFWETTDLDVAYGRIPSFMPDDLLNDIDIISDEHNYIGGHWTLYRNCDAVNRLFLSSPWSKGFMENKNPNGWVEGEFTQYANKSDLRIKYLFCQATRDNAGLEFKDGRLYQNGKEVMLSHFRKQKRWPL